MSSVKRSSLASSELGQLKAPDKWETSTTSSTTKTINASTANTSDITCDTMSSSAVKNQTQQQSRDAQKSANSTQQVTKNLDYVLSSDNELKNLLDEAFSYKGPKDIENKSDIFKELLHKAELEDQQQDTFFSSRQFRGNNRRQHTGGSLQDLVDSVNNEQLLDCDYILGPPSRRHHQHSRYTKNSSSVSSRQREGGSLPNNVNASSCYPVSSFSLSKYPKVNTKNNPKPRTDAHDYERSSPNHHRNAFIGESVSHCEVIQPSIASTSASVVNASDKNHTIINIDDPEETRHLLAHDSLAQDTTEVNRDDGTELVSIKKHRFPTMNYYVTSNAKDLGETSRQTYSVDAPIHFLKNSTAISEAAHLGKVPYTKSTIEPKYSSNKHVQLNPLQVNQKFNTDENGNAILQKPSTITLTSNAPKVKAKRSNKADRNTTTWTVEGQQSEDYNIDSIVAFIENKETSRKAHIINVNKNNLSATDRNRKEKKNAGKKEMNRLKKSTSMEELKSSSKIEEEIAQSERAQVSLRQKQLQNAQKRSTMTDNVKQMSTQQQANKRGERRSWGTEELNDFEPIYDRDIKKSKENKSKNNKKSEQITSTNASIESIPTNIEAAEFHVVTKKKKTKKRQILEEAKQINQRDQMQSHARNLNNSTSGSANKYQPSSSYTNDRDIYMNSLVTQENRRKSTSSMPPSDKSDSSDLDSVHSLPIESTTNCASSIISYAEIARKANQPEKLSNVNAWPSVSQNGKNSESPENSNTSTSSSIVSSRSQASNKSCDTIKASSPSDDKSASNSDDSRTIDTPKPTISTECAKNQLQKSKSCDSEKYTTTMSLDQFPGLEKTVKPQKLHPNFASVLTSPPPLLTASMPPLIEKPNKVTASAKKCPTLAEAIISKENAPKLHKLVEEKVEFNINVDLNCTKLQFLHNSANAEDIATSDSSNLFVPINNNMKKTRKVQHHIFTTQNPGKNVVVFSDLSNKKPENVSPLLFGDFNDDILQLMKPEVKHAENDNLNGPLSLTNLSASNCTNAFESADYSAINDCTQSKPNIHTPKMSSQSDPGYASAHRTTAPTESHEVVDIHQIHTENHVGNSTSTELSNKKSNVTKKINSNKIIVNNKTSDVVSNQSLNNNNNMINNNISFGDTMANVVCISQSFSDSDSLNNNINMQMNDKNRNHSLDGDVIKAQQLQNNDVSVTTKSLNAQNNVHNPASKTNNHQQKEIITIDNINNKTIENISNGPKMVPASKISTENDVATVNSHPANVPQNKNASFAENRASIANNHNHSDIIHFVGTAWEEVKNGRAHTYFSGQ